MDKAKKLWVKIAVTFFFLTATAGFLLRLMPVLVSFDIKFNYGILQAHSHTGFLGWVFLALYFYLLNTFGRSGIFSKKRTKYILLLLTFFLSGIYISFPFNDYGVFSITFLSLFLIFSYYTLIYFYKNIDKKYEKTIIKKILLIGIIFYFISSIGPWALAPIMALGYKKTQLYYDDIFLYLHFLYNGFVTFMIIALFLNSFWEKINNNLKKIKSFSLSVILLTIGTIISYTESLLWHKPGLIVNFIALTGVILIVWGVLLIYNSLDKESFKLTSSAKWIFYIFIISFFFKQILQVLQPIPALSDISYMYKGQFIIGYIHLVTLGFITFFILYFAIQNSIILPDKTLKIGTSLLITGYLGTEIILFLQGILLWQSIYFLNTYYIALLIFFSFFLFAGSFLLFINIIRIRRNSF